MLSQLGGTYFISINLYNYFLCMSAGVAFECPPGILFGLDSGCGLALFGFTPRLLILYLHHSCILSEHKPVTSLMSLNY